MAYMWLKPEKLESRQTVKWVDQEVREDKMAHRAWKQKNRGRELHGEIEHRQLRQEENVPKYTIRKGQMISNTLYVN